MPKEKYQSIFVIPKSWFVDLSDCENYNENLLRRLSIQRPIEPTVSGSKLNLVKIDSCTKTSQLNSNDFKNEDMQTSLFNAC